MLLSIIIPAYNSSKYIRKCLDSVLQQSFKDFEVIIIEDCSSDNTADIIREYELSDSRIKAIYQKENKGNGIGRNTALDYAQGDYIWYVDSDDYIESDALTIVYNHIKKYHSDAYVLSYNNCTPKKNNIKVTNKVEPLIAGNEDNHTLMDYLLLDKKNIAVMPWCYIIKKNLLIENSIRFDESGYYFEDVIFGTKLLYYSDKLTPIKEPLYNYIHHKGSITKTWNKKTIESRIHAYNQMRDFLKEKNIFEEHKKQFTLKFVKNVFVLSVLGYVQMKERNKEIEDFLYTFSQTPLIKNFSLKQLGLLTTEKNDKQEFRMNDKVIEKITQTIPKNFAFYLKYLRFICTLKRLAQPIS